MAKKHYREHCYDLLRAFEQVPSIMGLELVRKRSDLWWGSYYLNGQPHPYRKDKMKVGIYNRDIWVHEEGGISQSLATWLVNNGRAANYREAYCILDCKGKPLDVFKCFETRKVTESYVPRSVVDAMSEFDLKKCTLFRWMCNLFPENKVRELWKMYNVTTDSRGLACFWYADSQGRVAFDKRVKYKEDGHRDKSFGGTREYRTADGFTARPYFGAHLVGDEQVNIVESEKSALLACLAYGGTWIATGGKGNLRDVSNAKLYPDYDAREEWSNKGDIVEWWQGWHKVGATSDIGDLIEWKVKNNQ
jgi:hypothetical protein